MLHVHRSERADQLVEALGAVLDEPLEDSFAVEIVSVPARGVERWITQRLSHVLGTHPDDEDGICANVEFPHPSTLVAEALAVASGIEPEHDPWPRQRLVWPLLEAIDESASEPWAGTLANHLGLVSGDAVDHRRGRRLSTARHLAQLFDSYAASRPAMLRDWARGDDSDGAGQPLPDDLLWQAMLWRRVRDKLGTASPAERLPAAAQRLADQPDLVDLPRRLSLFGPTRLSTAQLDVLAALAQHRDVHLWLPHPSDALWSRIAGLGPPPDARRRDDPTTDAAVHPLLASLGRDSREMQLQIAAHATGVVDQHHALGARPATLLGRLQRALQDDTVLEPEPLDPRDHSLQIHACHGPERQVEVLREVLVGLLASDPTLEPRDVLVMCPDIEDYAPLISATFGLADDDVTDQHPGHKLRVRLADRSLRQTNPLLATIAALLELADSRVTASQVLDLAAAAPVRSKFRFTDDDMDRMQQWVIESGIRWGLDRAHRAAFKLDAIPQNTWRTGLDRILLGAAMAEEGLRWIDTTLPFDDVDSSDIDLAGRLAELLDRLGLTLDELGGTRPLAAWLDSLVRALDRLTEIREQDAWQRTQAQRELAEVMTDAAERAQQVMLSLHDVRALLADRLQGRPTRANFRTGDLTMCSMVPMRSVPHRVICLLGLDDGRFPRTSSTDGDDVLARDPCVGERDPRNEDRQLLLDALLAATDHLVILYTGNDPRTNAVQPPAVPVGEILDAAHALLRAEDSPARTRHPIIVRHPLQPFDARNFTAGQLGASRPFSFDKHALAGALRAARPRSAPVAFLGEPLDPLDTGGDLALDDLIAFLEHPVKAFLRQRLGLSLLRAEDELDDALAVQLDGLQQWSIGDRLLKARLGGADAETCMQAEWRRQSLPPGELGRRLVNDLMSKVEPLVAASADLRTTPGRAVDVVVEIDGRRVTGTVGTVHDGRIVRVEYSALGPKHRLRAWAQLLALTAAEPHGSWQAVTVGRGGQQAAVMQSTLGPLDRETALLHLADLVALYDKGMREPLPMAVKTSHTYAARRRRGAQPQGARSQAAKDWASDRTITGEQADPAHVLVWGEDAPLRTLTDTGPHDDELGDERWDESRRFGVLARRLWEPLLDAERLHTS